MTIGDLLVRNATKFPERAAVVSAEGAVDYRVLNERVNRLANALIGAGLRKGDRIGVLVHNCRQFM